LKNVENIFTNNDTVDCNTVVLVYHFTDVLQRCMLLNSWVPFTQRRPRRPGYYDSPWKYQQTSGRWELQ